MGPRVSLLMPNRNNGPVVDRALAALAANTSYDDYELIVVDDGSTDVSLEIIRRWRDSGRIPGLRLIEREHGGVVEALNAGLHAATGELVVQLDGDATVETPGWLERMVDFLGRDERIGAVTAKVVFNWGEIHACGISVVGPEGLHDRGTTITEPAGQRTYHQKVVRPREDECATCERVAEIDGGLGCCMLYRREVALEVGGYDAGFSPVWFDDLDLTLRMRRRGLKVFFLPDVRVVHHVGERVHRTRPVWGRAAGALWWHTKKRLPGPARRGLVRAFGAPKPSPEHAERLAHHYAYWREKWGFDILNPDMEAVRGRYGDTEVCWRTNTEMREAGERIAAAYQVA